MKFRKSKRVLSVAAGMLLLGTQVFGQNDAKLKSILEPGYSSGYIAWEGYPGSDVTYEVEILDRGNVVQTISTSNNFYHFDLPSFVDKSYRVKAIDGVSNDVIGVGEEDILWTQIQGYVGHVNACKKTCVGPDYAWSLMIWQEDLPGWSITDPAHLSLGPGLKDYDPNNAGAQYYYQAMTPAAYYAWESSTSNSQSYAQYQEVLGTSNTGIYDAYGTPMTGLTFFVEKKMKQYAWANMNKTTTFNPPSTVCDQSLSGAGGWIDRFNSYPHPDNVPYPGVGASTLSCISAPGGGSLGNGGGGLNGNWGPMPTGAADFYWCIEVFPELTGGVVIVGEPMSWIQLEPCPDELPSGPGGLIDHVELTRLGEKGNTHIFGDNGEFDASDSDLSHLESGLYRMMVVMQDGSGYSFFKELEYAPGFVPAVDDTDFSVSPNPGPGFFRVTFETTNDGVLTVRRTDGTTVMTQSVSGQNEVMVNIQDEQDGLYYIQVSSANGMTSKMVLKQ